MKLKEVFFSVEQAISQFSSQQPSAIAPQLAKGKLAVEALIESVKSSSMSEDAQFDVLHELEVKRRQFNDALIAALQISLNADVTPQGKDDPMMAMFRGARPTFQMATPGLSFPVAVHLYQPMSAGITVKSVMLEATSGSDWGIERATVPSTLAPSKAIDLRFTVKVPAGRSILVHISGGKGCRTHFTK